MIGLCHCKPIKLKLVTKLKFGVKLAANCNSVELRELILDDLTLNRDLKSMKKARFSPFKLVIQSLHSLKLQFEVQN